MNMRLSYLTSLFLATIFPLLACAQQHVSPPKLPRISPELTDEQLLRLKVKKQPAVLHEQLAALSVGTLDERIEKLKAKVLGDLVFMKGGSFMMGDFGPLWSPEGTNYTIESDNKPAHKVTLTSFSISRYKTTYAEYDVYLDATSQPHVDNEVVPYRNAFVPAGMIWSEAKNYCQWLGKQTGLPFDLPSEAQWEYAARSRGQFFVFGTDNGNLDYGRNVDDVKELDLIRPPSDNVDKRGRHPEVWHYPVGIFPANPMDLYDMATNGWEWTNDWYAGDYYKNSPEVDPTGPVTGTWKVTRSTDTGAGPSSMINMMRYPNDPNLKLNFNTGRPRLSSYPVSFSVRCAVHLNRPVGQKIPKTKVN